MYSTYTVTAPAAAAAEAVVKDTELEEEVAGAYSRHSDPLFVTVIVMGGPDGSGGLGVGGSEGPL